MRTAVGAWGMWNCSAITLAIGLALVGVHKVADTQAAEATPRPVDGGAPGHNKTAKPQISWPKSFPKPGPTTRVGVTNTKDGGQHASFMLPGTPTFADSDARFATWKNAIVASGWKVTSAHRTTSTGEWSASFALTGSKKRAFVTWAPTQRAIHGVLRTVPKGLSQKLPGTCVPIPQVRFSTTDTWRGDLRGRRGDPYRAHERHYETSYSYDVDGDGRLDALVPVSKTAGCLHHAQWDVYVTRGGCGHRLGRVDGPHFDGALAHGDVNASGFKQLVSSTAVVTRKLVRGAGQEQRGNYRTVVWKNTVVAGRYRAVRSETRTECAHCAVISRCVGPSGPRSP